jgi:nucleotide-binding universal stress UspA family protein
MDDPPLQHILVATDGSADADAACRRAASLARAYAAALTILHVTVPTVPRNAMSYGEAWRAMETADREGERILEAARAVATGVEPIRVELHPGTPADVICRRAEDLAVDLIVVGTRGLNMLDRILLGSVSTAVAQRAPCSVLVVRRAADARS